MQNPSLDGGTYEIIRNRLHQQAASLSERLTRLNQERKAVFGAIETKLIAADRIKTGNYCLARDIVAIGNRCLFGYNVHIGLRSGIQLSDVFSIYEFREQRFQESTLDMLSNEQFQIDFQNLYRYYKEAYFARFSIRDAYLYMVFRLKPGGEDIKTFKWLIADAGLQYIDNRSDHEVRFPNQYEFQWRRASRDHHRMGKHPHVSVLDRVFVETVGGDLTIKVEDNTDDGRGIYRESVEHRDQTLDDAEYQYADLGNLIALKIKPYQEAERYFIFNEKLQEVRRVDSLADSGVLLPDGHGLIFANGYYLQTGEYKIFETDVKGKRFKKRISSPNGEDYLYAFYDDNDGVFVLLHYNLISQSVQTPIICNGFTLFPKGELCYFKREAEPTKHHAMQIWQTPFLTGESLPSEHSDSYLYKVGNKDIVRAMAECQEIITLANKEDNYANLYDDLVRRCTDAIDGYYWIAQAEAFRLDEPLRQLRETANAAIDEFAKKRRIERESKAALTQTREKAEALFDKIKRQSFDSIDLLVHALGDLRLLRGEIIGLKALQYTDEKLIAELETKAEEFSSRLSEDSVRFLLEPEALAPYTQRIDALEAQLPEARTVVQGNGLEQALDETGKELELLIEVVSNLKIEDATQTTVIIDRISDLYGRLNQVRTALRRQIQDLRRVESAAEFSAQLKLLDQSIINFLSLSDTPARCDEYLTKLMVQLEELEGKFAEVNEFITQVAEKREAIFTAFEARKNELVEARNNRTTALQQAADRILEGMQRRVSNFKEVNEINSFFAADLLIDKVRDIVRRLEELEDTTKAGQIQARMKALQEEAIRQLRDKKELFEAGSNLIRLGRHRFAVNVQALELTTVRKGDELQLHLTGTQFYQTISDTALLSAKPFWDQVLVSENAQVYRAEYLAYDFFYNSGKETLPSDQKALQELVTRHAVTRYREGYTKGVHDEDAARIISGLQEMAAGIGMLHFAPPIRAMARLWWSAFCESGQRQLLQQQLSSAGIMLRIFPKTTEFEYLVDELAQGLRDFADYSGLFPAAWAAKSAVYLFQEMSAGSLFSISQEAVQLSASFEKNLKAKKAQTLFKDSVAALDDQPLARYRLIRRWVQAFLEEIGLEKEAFLDETACRMALDKPAEEQVVSAITRKTIDGMRGEHPVIKDGIYVLDYHQFSDKLSHYRQHIQPGFLAYQDAKRSLAEQHRKALHLEEFRPKVLTSFVRNRLIDQVYLPLFGDNLAKQIGTAGEATRTDRMGLLLLLSPPGYGKTTLMEYVASQLGLVFVKVNGPALGHRTHSLAPEDAPTLAARRELERLNLALEMGDNVMLYVDDIQHCDAEFLQKFISLCDGQRKIEGVFNGEARTYDLRGRRFCVVMAGNPYTESGTRFQIPDMLANRADVYNLGDIIGGQADVFQLSYIENALTANGVLRQLANRSMKDVYALLRVVESGNREGLNLEGNHAPEDMAAYQSVLAKFLRVRDVILKVNKAYIQSAAMEDDYRSEPAFKLQGSYRDMNKLAERIEPILNDSELETLLLGHYENEAQTLTGHAEANLLKLKELLGTLSHEEATRWADIKRTFQKNKMLRGTNGENPVAQVVAQLDQFNEGLSKIREAIESSRKGG
ncbi:MAG TPA: DNA repair ATPase [Saprospiraceae bacterium]|nr:DNA repair ATPase [Saprospiraceae bacterium]